MAATYDQLLKTLKSNGRKYDLDKIYSAYKYAESIHQGQMRESGEPYITHPLSVAELTVGLGLDTDSVCAALLHDVVEDTPEKTSVDDIREKFGDDVAELVDGLTKLVQISFDDKEEANMENLRKMFLAMSKDIRVIFIKLCDRLHNMRTLSAKKNEKQRTKALETMHVYAPLAHRLGMQKMKQELENLALSYLDPIGYNEIKEEIDKRYGDNKLFIESTKEKISKQLSSQNVDFGLEGRVKSVYSVYRKMYGQNKSFDEIFDFYALRIIVNTELDCYTVLGIIHDMFNSVPGRFKDYISTPKPNMYRSLHTTVIGRDGIPFEVQIRTWEMHRIAEYGIAAHWKYKSGDESNEEVDNKLLRISKLIDTENDTVDSDEFLQALKVDIFHDETFVFTPKGDVITLPLGSTLIDFAYAIHSAVGNKMVGAKVNGMIAPIDSVPETGQIVEIITSSSSKGPSRDWLKIVRTGEARNKIRQWFKKEKRSENIIVGKNEIDAEFKKSFKHISDELKEKIVRNIADKLSMNSVDDLYNLIGYGGISIDKVASKIKYFYNKETKDEQLPDIVNPELNHNFGKSNSKVIVDGVEGLTVKFAKCCNPLPGDSLIGFITKGYGVSIHRTDCKNLQLLKEDDSYDASRFVSARWCSDVDIPSPDNNFEANLVIISEQKQGVLTDIFRILNDIRVQIIQINSRNIKGNKFIVNLKVNCRNVNHLNSIISKLRTVSGVESVERGYNNL